MSDENIHTDITVSDIQLIIEMIEICAKRGTFYPSEFIAVGQLSKKLTAAIAPAKTDAEHLRSVGKHRAAKLLDESDLIFNAVQEATAQTEQDHGRTN